MFNKDVYRLVLQGCLENEKDSEQITPYFAQPKLKQNQVRFMIDFRYL